MAITTIAYEIFEEVARLATSSARALSGEGAGAVLGTSLCVGAGDSLEGEGGDVGSASGVSAAGASESDTGAIVGVVRCEDVGDDAFGATTGTETGAVAETLGVSAGADPVPPVGVLAGAGAF
ncbi:hypothetical protein LIER_14419 [Lithospermum erythrorhizon]|uniref:Uncharacterized protein n=1 Tax=Lithospermum erythrorhizon TaxID=34254 RepID=A0AAV3Q1C7_LITER